jgi:Ca-activated chloride channel family protein
MTKLSEFGKGAYTFIGDIAEVETKMTELFSKLESPALTNININFPTGINAEQALGSIPDLYKGEAITAVFKLNAIPNNLTISGNTSDGVFSDNISINASNNTVGIDTLWARRKIDQLMNKYQAQYRRIERDQVQQEITNLAIDAHLVSKFTSLVAVDITPSNTGDTALVTKVVSKAVKAAKTATNAQLWMLLGLALIVLSVVTRRRAKS